MQDGQTYKHQRTDEHTERQEYQHTEINTAIQLNCKRQGQTMQKKDIHRQAEIQKETHAERRTYIHTYIHTEGQTNIQSGREADRHTYGQTNKQKDKHTDKIIKQTYR